MTISQDDINILIHILRTRFLENTNRHLFIVWEDVQEKLQVHKEKLLSLHLMEQSGGEPDVVDLDEVTGEFVFMDCSPESPKGRRSLCYDAQALESRKENKPKHSAIGMAEEMGIEILSEENYRFLQRLGEFDLKTSTWLQTPSAIRNRGGAIFGDRRYGQVFIYHNGAESYYAARGFRGILKV
ncbi:MAG: DUF4256 domain-containing protein [Bacteroidales bacterium]|nr:DUF4256 domain-containing protein [Bacteroidales bacterium]